MKYLSRIGPFLWVVIAIFAVECINPNFRSCIFTWAIEQSTSDGYPVTVLWHNGRIVYESADMSRMVTESQSFKEERREAEQYIIEWGKKQ